MRVQVRLSGDRDGMTRDGVQHIHVRSDGALVLRFSDHKETVAGDDHTGFEVSPE